MDIVASFEAQMTIQYIDENVERPLKLRVPKGKYLFVIFAISILKEEKIIS